MMRAIPMGPRDGSSSLSLDIRRVFANITELLPDTKRILVVIGDSPIERYWVATIRKEEKSFGIDATLDIVNQLSLPRNRATRGPLAGQFGHPVHGDAC